MSGGPAAAGPCRRAMALGHDSRGRLYHDRQAPSFGSAMGYPVRDELERCVHGRTAQTGPTYECRETVEPCAAHGLTSLGESLLRRMAVGVAVDRQCQLSGGGVTGDFDALAQAL